VPKKKTGDEIIFLQPGKRLSFSDFKAAGKMGNSINDTPANIHKFGVIVKGIDVQLVTENNKTIFTIYAGMIPRLSWIKNQGDSITLNHEQGHFDICEIYSGRLRRDIRKVASMAEAKILYNKLSVEEEAEQDIYDKENLYSNGGITPGWRKKIERDLLFLKQFQQPVIEISFIK
jgi:hypothetical protein